MRDDQLAAEYLRRLRRATRTMPPARRRELLDEIAAHIAEARADGTVPLQRVLDDLGDPKDIAATGSTRSRLGVREVAAVILLLIGGFIFVVGWVVGLILLWASPRWRWPDKLLGTLVWPFGYAGVLYGLLAGAFTNAANNAGSFCGYGCTSTSQGGGMPTWLEVLILVAAFVPPIVVASRLVLRARWVPDQAERPISEPARI
jgi:HAAS domain-containing protein